jgi:hypothetical protein
LSYLLLGEQDILVVVDVMVDRVFHPDVKRFSPSSVHAIVPPKTFVKGHFGLSGAYLKGLTTKWDMWQSGPYVKEEGGCPSPQPIHRPR